MGIWPGGFIGRASISQRKLQEAGANIGYTAWADYSANNQFTETTQAPGGVLYDASGDILADGSNQYLYNADGQICAVHNMTGMTEYIYDAEGGV